MTHSVLHLLNCPKSDQDWRTAEFVSLKKVSIPGGPALDAAQCCGCAAAERPPDYVVGPTCDRERTRRLEPLIF